MGYRWTPSRTKAAEFKKTMCEIDTFCAEHGIDKSRTSDSYYFSVNGQKYRVSNHTVEASNAGAIDHDMYHPNGRESDTIYIHASKTRIIEIYNDLCAGYVLDGRGRRKELA